MQCAAYVGLRTRRLGGAVAAFAGFGLPAFFLMLALSAVYGRAAGLEAVVSRLAGLRVLAVALVASAAWEFGRSSLTGLREVLVAGASTVAFLLGAGPPLAIAGAGFIGAFLLKGPAAPLPARGEGKIGWTALRPAVLVLGVAIGFSAVLLCLPNRIGTLGGIMMKVDLFAFGGGLASVPLLFREIVDLRGWMTAGVFMDGIAMGQVTPGPIVITATFVGYQVAGLAGALLGTVGIFLPSLFMMLLAEPWFLRFRNAPVWRGAARGLALSFVGLLAAVTFQFARATAWSLPAAAIGASALAALLLKVNVVWIVLAAAAASVIFL